MALGIILCCMAALLPSLMLYFPNMDEIPFTGMLPFFGIMIAVGLLAWGAMYLITRRKGLAAVAARWITQDGACESGQGACESGQGETLAQGGGVDCGYGGVCRAGGGGRARYPRRAAAKGRCRWPRRTASARNHFTTRRGQHDNG